MKNFYYLDKSGEVKGPFSSEQMRELNRSGQVLMATQVCEEGTENWIPYYQTAIGLPPRKQGPQRIPYGEYKAKPKRKVQPKSNRSSIKENWVTVRWWWSEHGETVKGCGCGMWGILLLIGVLAGYLDDKRKEREKRAAEVRDVIASAQATIDKYNSPEYRKSEWSSRTILSVEVLSGHYVDEKYQDQQTSVTPMIGVSGGRRIYGVAPTTKQIEKTRKKWIPTQYRVEYRTNGGPVKIVTLDYDPSSYAR